MRWPICRSTESCAPSWVSPGRSRRFTSWPRACRRSARRSSARWPNSTSTRSSSAGTVVSRSTHLSGPRVTEVRQMAAEHVHVERRGRVLEVTLDKPKANAIDGPTSRYMGEVFNSFRDDPELRVALLTAAGERFFCAGWDLKEISDLGEPDWDLGVGGWGGLQELPDLNKPVIAALNGMAIGGGFELALCCDLIIAADHVTFALPEITAGTLADAATVKLRRRIPYHVAV